MILFLKLLRQIQSIFPRIYYTEQALELIQIKIDEVAGGDVKIGHLL